MDEMLESVKRTEIEHCAKDFTYFCEKYVKIRHSKHGLVPFILHNYQKRLVEEIEANRFVIGKKFRQGGFSTLMTVWFIWRFLFKLDEKNMMATKTDAEAIYLSHVAKTILDNLPDFLQPEFAKRTKHDLVHSELGNVLNFGSLQASRGRQINYLFIDEAAYISDMGHYWSSVFPCISTGSHVVVLSTSNYAEGWFYEMYSLAEKGRNEFHVYRCHYWEHPDYSNEDWVAATKQSLGAKGWRMEIMGEFLQRDNRKPTDKMASALEFMDEASAAQEFVKELEKDALKKQLDARDKLAYRQSQEDWEVKSGEQPGLVWEDLEEAEAPYCERTERPDPDRYKPEGYALLPKSKVEIEKILQEHQFYAKEIGDPEFDEFDIRSPDELAEFWDGVAYLFPSPQYTEVAKDWRKRLKAQAKRERQLERRINDGVCAELLCMAGLIDSGDVTENKVIFSRPDLVILHNLKASNKFPDEMEIGFDDGRLCINGCPTVINEDDVRDLYNGTYALRSYEEAISTTVSVLEEKLAVLFGRQGESDESMD